MTIPANAINLRIDVPLELTGKRLDQVASELISDYSRSRLQQWIRAGDLTVNHRIYKPRDKVFAGDTLRVATQLANEGEWHAEEDISFAVVHEDEQLIVINKPAGLVVHPAAGNRTGTLLNGLLNRWPELEQVPRAGIVHRLDKDTTGLMVVAKTLTAHTQLVRQLQKRQVGREYEAIVFGVMTGGGTVDAPIGRHPQARTKMAVIKTKGQQSAKDAVTHYRVQERFRNHTRIRVRLETGRTHQIRVHMSHIGYPLVGDSVYAGRLRIPKAASETFKEGLQGFKRQALHATQLTLAHPETNKQCSWQAPLPDDMLNLLELLRQDVHEQG